ASRSAARAHLNAEHRTSNVERRMLGLFAIWLGLFYSAGANRAPADDEQPAVKKAAAKKAEPDKAAAENRAAALDAKKAEEKKKVDNRTIQRKLRTRTDLKADK